MTKTPSASGLRLYALQRYANSSTAASYVLFTIAFASSSVNGTMPSDDVLNYASFLVLNSAVVSYSFSLIIAFIFDSFLLLFCALNSNLVFKFHGKMSDLNFNTYKGASYAGIWRNEGTNQTGTSNAPATADNGYLFVFAYGSQTKTVHIWVGIYKGVIQGRFYNGSSWTSWVYISQLQQG